MTNTMTMTVQEFNAAISIAIRATLDHFFLVKTAEELEHIYKEEVDFHERRTELEWNEAIKEMLEWSIFDSMISEYGNPYPAETYYCQALIKKEEEKTDV